MAEATLISYAGKLTREQLALGADAARNFNAQASSTHRCSSGHR
jgi:hypothetical protein